jgi:2-polyprenyl-3-methyl-5-hydroxy-6-metoxy-1,4-benzoquinol methylase
VDFLIYNDRLYFIEFNPRFQGSTFLIDKALIRDRNTSIFELQLSLFEPSQKNNLLAISTLSKMDVDLSYISNEFELKITHTPHSIISDGILKKYIRYIFKHSITDVNYQYNMADYYDYFANRYHLILQDVNESIRNQGEQLKKIFEMRAKVKVEKILDCTCGTGIQAISLARSGYIVYGSDISQAELDIAIEETKSRNLQIEYRQADCRYLENVFSFQFDAIISIDNALSHLLSEYDYITAFKSIYDRLHVGGIFLASYRDYNSMLEKKPDWAYAPRVKWEGKKSYVTVRNFEWVDDICISHQYFIENDNGQTKLFYNTYKQWAITREKLSEFAKKLPFSKIEWLLPHETDFYQPILCLIK